MPRKAEHKICPVCGELATGPYKRYVLNSLKRRYEPYYYMAHRIKKGDKTTIKWCYVKRPSVTLENCRKYAMFGAIIETLRRIRSHVR